MERQILVIKDDFILTILKVGYKSNAKVPRSVDSQSSDAKIEHIFAFGFKIIAAERLPPRWKTGGFLSRCLRIKTAPGDPQLVISETTQNVKSVSLYTLRHSKNTILIFSNR